ncbi:hypothetical protein ABIB40_002068 [Pedobacter sp. UYP30]|uniref:gluconate 2-dehydrogenase subunit 3 family protein n=1 Tax=Pedobacter sp. UYP30 TaxID=1756400 RepID=UPI0033960CC5
MNRRKAIKNILALGLVGGAGYAGFRAFELHKEANMASFRAKETLIADLADTIIPETDTPGAKAAKVEVFIISVLSNCTSNVEQNLFVEGLEDLERYCNGNFNKSFSACSPQQRVSVLTHVEKSELYNSALLNKINNKFFGVPFFAKLKELSIQGYCNSSLGASKGLAYDFIPGHFAACIPLKPNQKSWATK